MTIPDYRPTIPAERPAIGILGCGRIARSAHLPAYRRYGLRVSGVWSPSGAVGVRDEFPEVGRIYASADDLLADPEVGIVDLATGPEHRLEWLGRCVRAGKHVLAQKPLVATAADLAALREVIADAEAAGVRIAVNQNGRWAPAWRLTTLLVREGAIGDVAGVTHLHDKPLPPIAGTPFDDVPHMLLADYLVHWIDITRGWLGAPVTHVAASDSRVPGQPDAARNPWSATVCLTAADGATALIRVVGNAVAAPGGAPFWVHGTTGTLRGSVLLGSDRLARETAAGIEEYPLEGQWFVDGFAGTMGELMTAIAEDREPENSARDVAGTVEVGLAAVTSAERDGVPVAVG